MHAPSHSAALPAGVDPIPVPDTEREAEMLLILLDAGLYPWIPAHSDSRTTKLYDRRDQRIEQGEIERVRFD